jgi:hypothetical protein
VKTSANLTVVDGVHTGYLEQVLNKKILTIPIPVTTLLGDVITSFAGNSRPDLFKNTIGNATFLEGLLDHWNTTRGTNGTRSRLKMGR